MWRFLDKIPYPVLVAVAVWMLVAPIRPMPHVVEKLQMLKNGMLNRPVDIFDLIWHLTPTILLVLKGIRTITGRP